MAFELKKYGLLVLGGAVIAGYLLYNKYMKETTPTTTLATTTPTGGATSSFTGCGSGVCTYVVNRYANPNRFSNASGHDEPRHKHHHHKTHGGK